jgi:hypothetical protein
MKARRRAACACYGQGLSRYTLLVLAVLLAFGLSWIGFVRSDEPFYRGDLPAVAYLIATPIWIVFAVLDRRRLIWRLLLIWTPEALPMALLINVAVRGDNTGLGYLFAILSVGAFGLACLVGTVAALVYRPDEGSLRPTQP